MLVVIDIIGELNSVSFSVSALGIVTRS